jgi:hypothetical protein
MEAIMVKARDPEAEAVIKKAIEENREEGELERMRQQDEKAAFVPFEDENVLDAAPTEERQQTPGQVQPSQVPPDALPAQVVQQTKGGSSEVIAVSGDTPIGSEVIAVSGDTPIEALKGTAGKKVVFEQKVPGQQQAGAQFSQVPALSASSSSTPSLPSSTTTVPTTRPAETVAEGSPTKKAKSDPSKKPKLRRIEEEMELSIRTIRVGDEELFTVDEADMDAEDPIKGYGFENEAEENFSLKIPDCLWSDWTLDEMPDAPSEEIELEADRFEIERLRKMKVLREATEDDKGIQRSLTVKFVRDGRIKVRKDDGFEERKQWLRRSRLVAREYAIDRRDDTFSPASSTHLLRLIPMIFLFKLGELQDLQDPTRVPSLGCLDVKDAFLQVPQQEPLRISLGGCQWIVEKNLPGQRLGERAWFDYLAEFLEKEAAFEYCVLNPCLARNEHMALLMHVDDVMVVGRGSYIMDFFIPLIKKRFEISSDFLEKVGDKMTFLKRTYVRVDDGLVVVPGGYIETMLEIFESSHGHVRAQKVPADASVLTEDNSEEFNVVEATLFRSLVGMAI